MLATYPTDRRPHDHTLNARPILVRAKLAATRDTHKGTSLALLDGVYDISVER
jgi:hypothetical protein